MNKLYILVLAIILSSCDAYVGLSYVVKNKTSKPVKIFVPGYPGNDGPYGTQKDTILVIEPHGDKMVGSTMPRVTGPIGATRRVYREQPGWCGVKVVKQDSMVEIPCTKKKWKLRHGCGTLIIRK